MHIRFFQNSFLVLLLARDLNILQSVYGVMDPTLSLLVPEAFSWSCMSNGTEAKDEPIQECC